MFETKKLFLEDQDSPARAIPSAKKPLRIAALQVPWFGSVDAQKKEIHKYLEELRNYKTDLLVLPELSLYPYSCTKPDAQSELHPEEVKGESYIFAKDIAQEFGCHVVISFYENSETGNFNTALTIAPSGDIVMKTRKTHIPSSTGYFEDKYFQKGDDYAQVAQIVDAKIGTPTCYDQWFPELAREYGLIETDLLCYPTAIGSEPKFPEFDTQPSWRQVMIGHAIANGLFVVAVNRIGTEDGTNFFGSSFIADPYGRVLLQASQNLSTLLIADLDLDMKRDWLDAFPFYKARRPEMYRSIPKNL